MPTPELSELCPDCPMRGDFIGEVNTGAVVLGVTPPVPNNERTDIDARLVDGDGQESETVNAWLNPAEFGLGDVVHYDTIRPKTISNPKTVARAMERKIKEVKPVIAQRIGACIGSVPDGSEGRRKCPALNRKVFESLIGSATSPEEGRDI